MKLHLFLLTLVCLVAACAQVPERKPFVPPVFPPPPAEPRFVFEHTLVSSAQVPKGDRRTRLRFLLTGESEGSAGLGKPYDVAVCRGQVYVSDTVRREVLAFDFAGGRFIEIGVEEPGVLVKPLGLGTDEACNLYVADITGNRIMVYNKDGEFLRALGGEEWFGRVSHLAVDKAGTRIFAVDTGGVQSADHRVRVFDAQNGAHLYDIGTRGKEEGEFNLPRDIVIGANNRLYVVDGANFRVQVFELDGQFVNTFGRIGRRIGQFARPKGIAADNDGNVYVTDSSHGNFQIFNADGQLLLNVGTRSTSAGPAGYMLPAGIDVDEDGRVYMVDQFFRKVDIYRPASLPTEEGHLGAWARALNAS